MKYSNKNPLGLTTKETKILKSIKEQSLNISQISRQVKLPRTSVSFLLQKLLKRKFVQKIKINNHFEWKAVSIEKIATQFRGVVGEFANADFLFESINFKNIGINVYQGEKGIKIIIDKLKKENNKIYFLQGNKSARDLIKNVEKQYLKDLHSEIKKRKIILEGIMGEDTFTLFKSLSNDELESHLGRPTIVYKIENKYIDFNIDIMWTSKWLAFIDYQEKSIIYLENKKINQALSMILSFMTDNTKKIDLNKYIKELLQN